MEHSGSWQDNEQFVVQLQECANQLVDKLQNDKYHEASELIHTLLEARDDHIFKSVGQLTRGLHDAIVNFHVDANVDADPAEISGSEIRDASDRLQYVINLTESAADKTMDKVEAITPIAMSLGIESQKLKLEWVRLKKRELTKDDFKLLYDRVDGFLNQMGDGTDKLNKSLQDIILEQGYQDLTGQVLKKVISLVTNVETELVNLMRIAGQVEKVTGVTTNTSSADESGVVEAEGPQIHAEKRADVVSGQDEVDDLLSSLGF